MKLKQVDDLKQRELVAFTRALREMKPSDVNNIINLPLPEYYDVSLKAAAKAGWFVNDVTNDDIGDMRPTKAAEMARLVWDLYEALNEPDPN